MSLLLALLLSARAETGQGVHLPDHPWDVTHLDLDLALDLDHGHVTGRATLDATRLGAPSKVLTLHQRHLRIDEVLVDGKPVPYHTRLDRLDIEVPVDRQAVQVAIRYEAEPMSGLHFRGIADAPQQEAKVVWSQGEAEQHRYWFPSWDHPTDRFTVSTHLTVAGDQAAYAIGTLQEKTPLNDGRVRWSYRLEEPVVNYLVAIMAGEVDEVVLEGEAPVPLTLLVPKGQSAEAARRATAPTAQMFAYFQDVLDEPFPYPTYRQVFAPRFLYGGMENPGFVLLADWLRIDCDDEDPTHAHRVVAHELAHQWFGDLLTCQGWTNLWLNEGFATYWAARWESDAGGDPLFAERLHGWHGASLGSGRPVAPIAPTYQGRDNDQVYVQGASVLRMLEVQLGRDTFDAAIRTWVERHKGQLVSTDQLRRVFWDVSGRDVGPWFDTYIHGVGQPKLVSAWRWDAEANQLHVSIEQPEPEDPAATPVVRLPLELAIATDDGPLVVQLTVGPGRTELVRELSAAPHHVAVDPRGGLLAHWDRQQTPPHWAHQARHAADPYARLTALHALHETAEPEVIEALTAILADPKEHDVFRRAAAEALATLPSETAVEALWSALDSRPSPGLRTALYAALGKQGDRVDATRLVRATRDPSVPVRTDALEALVHVDTEKARIIARRWLSARDSDPEAAVHASALAVLDDAGHRDDIDQALPFLRTTAPTWPHSVARSLVMSHLDELDGDDPVRGQALRRVEALLDSRDLRAQEYAIAFLGEHGDDDSVEALTAWAAGTRWNDLASRARDAARLIRTRKGPEPIADEDLEALKEELAELKKRVEELERF